MSDNASSNFKHYTQFRIYVSDDGTQTKIDNVESTNNGPSKRPDQELAKKMIQAAGLLNDPSKLKSMIPTQLQGLLNMAGFKL